MGKEETLDLQDPKVNLDFRVFQAFLETKEKEDTRVQLVLRVIEDPVV